MSFNAGAITGSIGLDTAPLDSATRHVRGELGGLESASSGVFSRMRRIVNPFTLAIAGIGIGLAAITASIGFGGKLAAEAEQAEVAFGVMLGSTEAAKDLLGELNQFAASTPFEMPGLTEASRKLLAFGSDAGQVIPELRAIGDISAGIGAPISEIAELYGKARVQGRLMAEDINQLTGRGIPIIAELAKQFGVAESEVKGLVSEGRVGFSNLQQAFVDMTAEGGQFAGLMAAQSVTLSGLVSTLRDNVGLLARDLTADLFDRIDLKGLIADFTEAIPVIKGVLEGVIDLSINGLGELARWLGFAGDSAGVAGNKIVAAMEVGAMGVAFVADSIDAAVFGYDLLRLGALKFMSVAAGGIAQLAELASGLPEWLGGGVATDVADFADLFAANLEAEIKDLKDAINDGLVAPSSGDRVMAFFDGIRNAAEAAAAATASIGDGVGEIEIAADITGGVSKSVQSQVDRLLESIETPIERFNRELGEIRGFFDQGLIDQGQFDKLQAKLRDDIFGEQKLAGLNLVGSNEELQLRARQSLAASGAGAPGAARDADVPRKSLFEQKDTNKKLDTVASLLRQLVSSDQAITIPGL
jgi:tape measure domain-containing protein